MVLRFADLVLKNISQIELIIERIEEIKKLKETETKKL